MNLIITQLISYFYNNLQNQKAIMIQITILAKLQFLLQVKQLMNESQTYAQIIKTQQASPTKENSLIKQKLNHIFEKKQKATIAQMFQTNKLILQNRSEDSSLNQSHIKEKLLNLACNIQRQYYDQTQRLLLLVNDFKGQVQFLLIQNQDLTSKNELHSIQQSKLYQQLRKLKHQLKQDSFIKEQKINQNAPNPQELLKRLQNWHLIFNRSLTSQKGISYKTREIYQSHLDTMLRGMESYKALVKMNYEAYEIVFGQDFERLYQMILIDL